MNLLTSLKWFESKWSLSMPKCLSTDSAKSCALSALVLAIDQTDREVFESTLEEALGSQDFSGHLSTSDLDRYAEFIITALHTAVDKAIPKSKSVRPESNPISNETLALIKEKRKLRRQYSQMKDPAVKTRINQLQKQVKDDLRVESQASWEKFCNSISLETDSNESWRKIKNFLKPKGQRDYPKALAINLELSCNQNLTLATIYCPNGKPNFSLFQTINNLSDNVMFVGDFNSKLEAFGCASKNDSGPVLKTIRESRPGAF